MPLVYPHRSRAVRALVSPARPFYLTCSPATHVIHRLHHSLLSNQSRDAPNNLVPLGFEFYSADAGMVLIKV